MRKSRFSEEQIIKILQESEAGWKVPDLCRDHGISQETFYRWRRKFGGMEISDAKRLKQLEDENRLLKGVVADLTLDKEALKDVLGRSGPRGESRHDDPEEAIDRGSGAVPACLGQHRGPARILRHGRSGPSGRRARFGARGGV